MATMGTAVLARPRDAQRREEPDTDDRPRPEEIGECPYCHGRLERRTVESTTGDALFGNPRKKELLLEFYGCTNERCRLMFWKLPHVERGPVRPFRRSIH